MSTSPRNDVKDGKFFSCYLSVVLKNSDTKLDKRKTLSIKI